jgi:hypothetical protein
MSGRTKTANAPTRYAGLQVQTSALGLVIPLGWGTYRTKANIVWYGGFKSHATKAAAAGKGGATTTGYTYNADVVMALCEGPINAITTVWKDSTTLTTLKAAGLGVSLGAIGQPVWGYLETHDPTQAIGYSGLVIAYASNYALDSSANLPDHSFEIQTLTRVAGLPDANPADILTDWFTNPRYGVPNWPAGSLADWTSYRDYCLAANLLLSPVIDTERAASDFLHEILQASNSDCVWSEGVLKIIPYGDTQVTGNGVTWTPNLIPVYALDDDSYEVKDDGDDPITVDLEDQSDAYNIVQIDYLSRSNAYNSGLKVAQDAANIDEYGRRKQDPTSLHSICDDQVAMNVAQLVLQRTLYIRCQYKFNLPWTYDLLEPMDIIEVNDATLGLVNYPVRIVQIDEDEDAILSIIAEDVLAGVSHAPIYAHQDASGFVANQQIDPGGVEANLLLWSQDQTNPAWTHAGLTVAPGAADPYGSSTADTLAATTADTAHATSQAFTGFAGAAYMFAVHVAPAGRKLVQVQLLGPTSSASITVDASTGLIVTPATAGGGAEQVVGAVSAAANGFWRIAVGAILGEDTALTAQVGVLSDAGAATFAGDGSTGLAVWGAQVKQGVDIPVHAATTAAIAGPILFNPPSALTTSGSSVWAAVAGGANWGGCNVWTSLDGDDYQQVGTINGAARYGVATTALPIAADPDTSDSLGVDLGASGGVLTSASTAAADASSTLCLIDNELISFSTATLTNPSRYTLSGYMRRGVLNSTIAAHAVGAPITRLDNAVFDLPYLATQKGQTVLVKFQSFNTYGNALQSLADCNVYTVTPSPSAMAPASSAAWTATGTTLSTGGIVVPAIVITGACDNPSATGVVFFHRVHGTTPWTDDGINGATVTTVDITSVIAQTAYDVGVAYLVNGVLTSVFEIGTVTTGAAGYGALASLNTTNTLQITPNAVTDPSQFVSSGSTAGTGAYAEIFSETFTLAVAGQINVWAQFQTVGGSGTSASYHTSGLRIEINGAVVATNQINSQSSAIGVFTAIASVSLPAGSNTVTLNGLVQPADSYQNVTFISQVVFR